MRPGREREKVRVMKKAIQIVCVVAILAGLGSAASAVEIETVHVGNVGNSADTRYDTPGYGAVDYEYNIGKYEVTAGQYTEFLNAVAKTDTHGLYDASMDGHPMACRIQRSGAWGSYTYSVASDWADRPVNYVSFWDAARFANWLHNAQPTGVQDLTTTEDGAYYLNGVTNPVNASISRESDWKWAIPTEDEWYKAAYHKNDGVTGNYFDYPTSSDSVPGYIGDGESITDPDPGNYATYNGDSGANGIGLPYYRTEAGEHENSGSPYGAFDQGGNVSEWNEALKFSSHRGLLGGNYIFDDVYLLASSFWGSGYARTGYSEIGFRVAEVPEPATLSGLVLGGLALVRRRKRGGRK